MEGDLGEVKYYLFVSFVPKGYTMIHLQSTYCSAILKELWMELAKTASTLMVKNIRQLPLDPMSNWAPDKQGK